MTTMIEQALATATTVTEYGEIDKLAQEEKRLYELAATLLPIERGARQAIEERIEETQARRLQIATAKDLEGLQRLDPDVFSWTKEQPAWKRSFGRYVFLTVPVFAYVPITRPECELRISHHTHGFKAEGVPQLIQDRYFPIVHEIRRRHLSWEGRESITLSYSYPGVVPDHVREVITHEQETRRFSELALVCEVDAWKVGSIMAPEREYLDPILVGVRNNDLWVLTSFDPTPVEKYLLDEFAS